MTNKKLEAIHKIQYLMEDAAVLTREECPDINKVNELIKKAYDLCWKWNDEHYDDEIYICESYEDDNVTICGYSVEDALFEMVDIWK